MVKHQRDFVNAVHILGGDDRILAHVAEQGDFSLDVLPTDTGPCGTEGCRAECRCPEFLHAVLGRLGLHFAGGADVGHQRQVNVEHVLLADVGSELTDGLQKRQTLDVADGSADLHDDHIHTVRHQFDAVLDLIGDVGNDLNCTAQIVSLAFFGNDRVVDFSGRKIVVFSDDGVGEPFVVPQIQIGFGPVVGDKDLPVLKRIHCARIDVDVRIQFLNRHGQPATFEQGADSGRCQPFTE